MTEMNKINFEELENVAGGKDVQVHNTSVPYANLRKAPGLDAPIKCKLDNGDWVGTTGRKVKKDGYVWYEVILPDGSDKGWVAGSLIGY
jgi:hypothetical protein